ncbi:hypothetical protein P171DRAFT_131664 [Karstenula rhodostoma CBS 690.94]|uniref:Uncharacterized protein n=1 Tax=Karstenula rhodostoma CBS 690.94 TaxID=1392251 RepID=A0A9P4P9E4_9PLEO|nr:hypothetical protein P171DRAFT_131664 [Karstenula rhodostoma CBS 690.94]
MSARQQPEQPQMGPVPLARMEQWFNLKQEQDNTRSEFERRVADARRQLLERHAHEQQAFWTGQPCVAWQPPANADSLGRTPNGQVATPPRQQAPQRPVDQAPPPGPRPPARNAGNPAQNHLKAPANAPNKVAAKAVPPTATPARTPAAAQRQVRILSSRKLFKSWRHDFGLRL